MNNSPSVSVKGLWVTFGDFHAVKDVTFEVMPGEIFGFLGANGAGKTTTIRVLCGLLDPTKGEVTISGIHYESPSIAREIKKKVGYMSQKFTLYDDMTVDENMSFMANLRKLDKKYFEDRKKWLLEFISFKKDTRTLVKDLSGGMKQQLALATAILHDPDIIFLDEPTAGVTSGVRAKFWNLIKELAAKGKTIFVTSHYMDEVEQCDRIALMRSGELIALDSPEQLKIKVFPEPIYELSSKDNIPYREIDRIKKTPYFSTCEAHGIVFHVIPKNEKMWQEFLHDPTFNYDVKQIPPSLEDVFIRLVEGANR